MRRGKRPGRGEVPGQLHINWSRPPEVELVKAGSTPLVSVPAPLAPMVQYLKWDFTSSFPEPTPEAIQAGVVAYEDCTPEAVRAIHDEHAREAMAVLHDLDAVLDARRRGVDPCSDKPAKRAAAKERLQQFFVTEPMRLEHWWQNLMDVYEQAFGAEAADAFAKTLRARHAGIPVKVQPPRLPAPAAEADLRLGPVPPSRPSRPRAAGRLPVPRPLSSAIAAGRFGVDENGNPVRPDAQEVRAITEQHADKLVDLLDTLRGASADTKDALLVQFMAGITAYAEDFGQPAADQFEAYTRRQAGLDPGCRRGR